MNLWTAARQASWSFTISRSLFKLMFIESLMTSNHLILCHPLLLLPSIFPSIRGFSNRSAICIRWPKYWSFSFNISPSNENSGLIFLRIDWFDLLEVQGTLKSLPSTTVQKHQFFGAPPLWSNSHIRTWYWKNHSSDCVDLVGKVMSLQVNTMSTFGVAFLQGTSVFWCHSCTHCPQWFWSPRKQRLSLLPLAPICHEVMGPDAMNLVFLILSFKSVLPLSSFTLIKRVFSSSSLSAIRVVSSAYLRLLCSFPENPMDSIYRSQD